MKKYVEGCRNLIPDYVDFRPSSGLVYQVTKDPIAIQGGKMPGRRPAVRYFRMRIILRTAKVYGRKRPRQS